MDAVETAYFADRPAWHGKGNVVVGARTSAEAMALGGADFRVEKHPAFTEVPVLGPEGVTLQRVRMPGRYAVTRELPGGTVRVLGDVGEQWTPFQNAEAAAFLDSLVDSGDLRYESVLVLHGGRVIVLLARRPDDIVIGDGDRIVPYIALVNSHDGSMALSVRPVETRVVCANTLQVALRERTLAWKVRHTSSLTGRVEEARRTLRLHYQHTQAWAEAMQRLLDQPFGYGQFHDMVTRLFPVDTSPERKRRDPNAARRQGLLANYQRTRTVPPAVLGTKWGAFNAATEYLEHGQRLRAVKGADQAEQRLVGALFGSIREQRQRVYDYLTRT